RVARRVQAEILRSAEGGRIPGHGRGPVKDSLEERRAFASRGLADALGIEIVDVQKDRIVATMPVDERTRQPYGILHGGASVALAETVASIAAIYNAPDEQHTCVGVEINANHIRSKRDGVVTATGT